MSRWQLVAMAVAAILVFWVVGAHNRLVKQRNAIARAWERLSEALQQRAEAAGPLTTALAEPLAAEQGALQAWTAAHEAAAQAAAAMAAKPVDAANAAAWVSAEAALSAAAARLFALLEQQAELARSDAVAPFAAAWHEGQGRLPFARQAFNEASQVHDEALAQFPTRLLAPLFGFRGAGRL